MSDEKNIDIVHAEEARVEDENKLARVQTGKVKTVANAELYEAVKASPLSWKSRSSIHLFYSMFIAFICDCANGFDGSLMSAILSMTHFQNKFNAGANLNTSVIFSMYTVGSMIAAPIGATISDRYGRKKTMVTGACVIICGSIIIASSFSVAQLVVGRTVLGMGIAIMVTAAPAYVQEVAPPQWRGRCVGLYNLGWYGGSIPAAVITYGRQFIDSDLSWRLPLALQCFACIIVLTNVWFIPESPRWQMMNGQEEEALQFLIKYHGNGDPNSALVHLEFNEWKEGIATDGIDKRWWDYAPLVSTHSSRWRMAQVAMISIIPQFCNGGLGYYSALTFRLIGITSSAQQLMINMISSIVSCISALSAAALTDFMPRRKAVIFGTIGCAGMLALNAGLTSKINDAVQTGGNVTQSIARGVVASGFLFGIFFSFGFTPLQAVIPTEALETTTRAKGLAFSSFFISAIGFINQFAAPIGLNRMGYKYIWIWVAADVLFVFVWYFFCVESKGRTLEELADIYAQKNPVKASLKKDVVEVE